MLTRRQKSSCLRPRATLLGTTWQNRFSRSMVRHRLFCSTLCLQITVMTFGFSSSSSSPRPKRKLMLSTSARKTMAMVLRQTAEQQHQHQHHQQLQVALTVCGRRGAAHVAGQRATGLALLLSASPPLSATKLGIIQPNAHRKTQRLTPFVSMSTRCHCGAIASPPRCRDSSHTRISLASPATVSPTM